MQLAGDTAGQRMMPGGTAPEWRSGTWPQAAARAAPPLQALVCRELVNVSNGVGSRGAMAPW